jgi:hypothetical protein
LILCRPYNLKLAGGLNSGIVAAMVTDNNAGLAGRNQP